MDCTIPRGSYFWVVTSLHVNKGGCVFAHCPKWSLSDFPGPPVTHKAGLSHKVILLPPSLLHMCPHQLTNNNKDEQCSCHSCSDEEHNTNVIGQLL